MLVRRRREVGIDPWGVFSHKNDSELRSDKGRSDGL